MYILRIISLCFLLIFPIYSFASLNVFTCEPEWAALAKEIGKENIKVYSAISARQDPHYIRARPGLIAKIRKTDLLICTGASLEIGWLPILLRRASGNLQPGNKGYLMAADYIDLLEKPKSLNRSLGHLHKDGNPHIHLNPNHLLPVAKEIMLRLQTLDPNHAKEYQTAYLNFKKKLNIAIKKWEEKAKKLKGQFVISHHLSFSYFIKWLDLNLLSTLEIKPGVPPSTGYLKNLLKQTKTKPVLAILKTPYDNNRAAKWLSKKTNLPNLTLAYTVGGSKEVKDLFSLYDSMIDQLLAVHETDRVQ